MRKGNLKKMRDHAEDVKAQARIGNDIIGDQKAQAAEQQAAETATTVGALVKMFLAERQEMTKKVKKDKYGRLVPVTPTLRHRTQSKTNVT